MMLKSDTTENYGVCYKTLSGSEIVFKPPKAGIYPLRLFCGQSAQSLSVSASFFVECEDSDTADAIVPFPKAVYGAWGPVGAALTESGISCMSDEAYVGFHQAKELKFSFNADSKELAYDCKRYESSNDAKPARSSVLQRNLKEVVEFEFSSQSPGIYSLIIVQENG